MVIASSQRVILLGNTLDVDILHQQIYGVASHTSIIRQQPQMQEIM